MGIVNSSHQYWQSRSERNLRADPCQFASGITFPSTKLPSTRDHHLISVLYMSFFLEVLILLRCYLFPQQRYYETTDQLISILYRGSIIEKFHGDVIIHIEQRAKPYFPRHRANRFESCLGQSWPTAIYASKFT